jgi:hypothetical protein
MLSLATDLKYTLDPVAFAEAAGIVCDAWQADLLRTDPRRAQLNCSRQSGKSTVTALKALHTALFESASLVVLLAPAQRQSAEMLRTIKLMHRHLDDAVPMKAESVLKIEFENDSRILALPGGESDGRTIRGLAGARLIIVDEAARVPDEIFAAVRPMLATNADGAMILLSTPAGRRGAFFELWHNGDPTWHRVRVPASECPRISKEFLAEELRELGQARFSEEYELAFIDSDTAAFSTAIIDAAFDETVRPLWC